MTYVSFADYADARAAGITALSADEWVMGAHALKTGKAATQISASSAFRKASPAAISPPPSLAHQKQAPNRTKGVGSIADGMTADIMIGFGLEALIPGLSAMGLGQVGRTLQIGHTMTSFAEVYDAVREERGSSPRQKQPTHPITRRPVGLQASLATTGYRRKNPSLAMALFG